MEVVPASIWVSKDAEVQLKVSDGTAGSPFLLSRDVTVPKAQLPIVGIRIRTVLRVVVDVDFASNDTLAVQ
jgi:hypothetical protein